MASGIRRAMTTDGDGDDDDDSGSDAWMEVR